MGVRVHYTTKIPALSRDAERKADQVIRKGAFDILAHSQRAVPVVTGNLKGSGFVETGDLQATIGYGAEYAVYVEVGANGRSGVHYLRGAFDAVAPSIMKALKVVAET